MVEIVGTEAEAATEIMEVRITDIIADTEVEAAEIEITEEIDILHRSKNSKSQLQV